MTTRRGFLKAAAVLPAVAALPAAASTVIVSPDLLIEGAYSIAPAAAPAWGWWIGRPDEDENRYSDGPFKTRDEALAKLPPDHTDTFRVIEATLSEPSFRLNCSDIIQLIDERNEELTDPDGDGTIFTREISDEAALDLEKRFEAMFLDWMQTHGIDTSTYRFDATRNLEELPGRELRPGDPWYVPRNDEVTA